jgi:hypothetical protein
MAVLFSPWGNQQFIDANGNPLVGGKIQTFAATSSTPLTTFTDASGTVQQSNPIILNSRGAPTLGEIWLTSGLLYKFQLFDAANNLIDTVDNVAGVPGATTTTDEWVDSGVTPLFVSASSYTLVGDQTTQFHQGRRQKFQTTAGTVYGTILTSVFTTLTTVTVQMDGTQVLDSGLSSVQLSILRSRVLSLPERIASTTGTNTYVATVGIANLVLGEEYKINFSIPNDGTVSPTLNLDGLGVQPIVLQNGTVPGAGALNGAHKIRRTTAGFVVLNPIVPMQIAVRQSGQYGPTVGTPAQSALFPASQIGNTIAVGATAKFSTKATLLSIASGFNADGSPNNINVLLNADLSITGLTASSTNIIAYDKINNILVKTVVSDTDTYGGTPAVTSGLYTLDYLNWIMYLGNGATAVPVQHIILAEIDTSPTVITAIRNRPYRGYYESPLTASATTTETLFAHGMGTQRYTIYPEIQCITADSGYVAGNIRNWTTSSNGTGTLGNAVSNLSKTIALMTVNSTWDILLARPGTSGATTTLANWQARLKIRRDY